MEETVEINSMGTADHVDVTVAWRPRDTTKFPPPGEGVGGQASGGIAHVVGGNLLGKEFTAPIMAQEVGHLFGLEPKDSPHIDDPINGTHSKDPQLIDPFAFDFYLLRAYFPYQGTSFLGDVMSFAWNQGRDSTLYNAYDWEHMRQRLYRLTANADQSIEEIEQSKDMQHKMVKDIENIFIDMSRIKVEEPELALLPKQGFEWRWTSFGFQSIEKDETRDAQLLLTPSAEIILSALKKLGIDEAYAPVGDRVLGVIINPKRQQSVHKLSI